MTMIIPETQRDGHRGGMSSGSDHLGVRRTLFWVGQMGLGYPSTNGSIRLSIRRFKSSHFVAFDSPMGSRRKTKRLAAVHGHGGPNMARAHYTQRCESSSSAYYFMGDDNSAGVALMDSDGGLRGLEWVDALESETGVRCFLREG